MRIGRATCAASVGNGRRVRRHKIGWKAGADREQLFPLGNLGSGNVEKWAGGEVTAGKTDPGPQGTVFISSAFSGMGPRTVVTNLRRRINYFTFLVAVFVRLGGPACERNFVDGKRVNGPTDWM